MSCLFTGQTLYGKIILVIQLVGGLGSLGPAGLPLSFRYILFLLLYKARSIIDSLFNKELT
jgi:hypothetical protein